MEFETDYSLSWLFENSDVQVQSQNEIEELEDTKVDEQVFVCQDPESHEVNLITNDIVSNDTEIEEEVFVCEDPESHEVNLDTNDIFSNDVWENTISMLSSEHHHALQMLTSEQLELLLKLVSTLRQQRIAARQQLECRFCKTNGEAEGWYSCHTLKDRRGRVLCPVLRSYACPRCGATGDRAHTIKYCPLNHEQ